VKRFSPDTLARHARDARHPRHDRPGPHEPHRAATPLELLYDLCFVVAIAQAAHALNHAMGHGHALDGVIGFALAFFTIWWAWMNFTWFASAFDTDDPPYRVSVLVQMCGVLVLAAGVPRAMDHMEYGLITAGYVIMRVGLIANWLRAAAGSPEYRKTALRYAIGVALCQAGWIALLFMPRAWWVPGFFVLMPLELLVPIWAESARQTPWHAHHIAERYGLMTIIVIGESVLAATLAIQSALDLGSPSWELWATIAGCPLIFFSMWWLYFARPHADGLTRPRNAFLWGYFHYFIFAAAAAVGAGLALVVDALAHAGEHERAPLSLGLSVSIPLSIYLACLALLRLRQPGGATCALSHAATILVVLAASTLPGAPLWQGLAMAVLTGVVVVLGQNSRL
jgi:low temperature requirement protein LtrA